MRNIFSELAYDITQLMKGSGRVILMYDEDGNRTYDQRSASKIFAYPDKMMIILTDDGIDSSVVVALSQNTDVIELQDFINSLRHLCANYNVLFNIQKYGKEIEPKDFTNYGSQSSDLNECLEFFNKNRIVNELFTNEVDVEIEKIDDENYQFIVDNKLYNVFLYKNEILFANDIKSDYGSGFSPTGNNKNQFLILNTVLKCIDLIFQNTNKDYYYFSGNNLNGLSKLYKIMFNKLKNNVKKYNLIPIFTNDLYYSKRGSWLNDQDICCWYFIKNTQKGKELIKKAEEQEAGFPFQFNESKINELFKDNSDIDIEKIDDEIYKFKINDVEYLVESDGYSINFENSSSGYSPTGNNKNQFLILNTVLKCIDLIFQNTNKDYYYFSGEENNGLAKLYTIMFNKLQNNTKKYNLIPVCTNNFRFHYIMGKWIKNEGEKYWYFINPNTEQGEEMIIQAKEQDLPFVENL